MKNGGWTVVQRRRDGSENFYRGWAAYVANIGNSREGSRLDWTIIHCLTLAAPRTELRVDLADFFGNYRHTHYDFFNVNGPNTNYILDVGYHNWTSTVQDRLIVCSLPLKIETMIRIVGTVLVAHCEEDGGTRAANNPT